MSVIFKLVISKKNNSSEISIATAEERNVDTSKVRYIIDFLYRMKNDTVDEIIVYGEDKEELMLLKDMIDSQLQK